MTEKSRAYYALVSRLRRAGLPFTSLVKGSDMAGCGVVLSTAEEAPEAQCPVMALEELDEDPEVFMGQVLAEMEGEGLVVRIGVDPGIRMGFAAFFGETRLGAHTYHSNTSVSTRVAAFSRGMPSSPIIVRIGNGDRAMAKRLAEAVHGAAPRAIVEVVDESGTSARSRRTKGIPIDQSSAAKIAFRKGDVVSPKPRTRG